MQSGKGCAAKNMLEHKTARFLQQNLYYSKSAVMHDAVIKLYAHHSNADHHL